MIIPITVRECILLTSTEISYCGMFSQVSSIEKQFIPRVKYMQIDKCTQAFQTNNYSPDEHTEIKVKVNATSQTTIFEKGSIYLAGSCQEEHYRLNGKLRSGILVEKHIKLTLLEYTAFFDLITGFMKSNIYSNCRLNDQFCKTG